MNIKSMRKKMILSSSRVSSVVANLALSIGIKVWVDLKKHTWEHAMLLPSKEPLTKEAL